VLAEGWEKGCVSGRAEGGQLLHFPGDAAGIGAFHRVKVTEAQTWTLKGEVHAQD
jgi:tRNA A37 methylthiotransferase MiaB